MRVRKIVHRNGYRYRLHRKDLPGKPDLVFPSRRIALFVHGCFWHGHSCKRGDRIPATNVEYWREKIDRNQRRDTTNRVLLRELGWTPVVVWECQTLDDSLPCLLNTILETAQSLCRGRGVRVDLTSAAK
jgi:DNA mismatch endonuclease (patch repair protein)